MTSDSYIALPMIAPEVLARSTLDTLPINIAVLDEEGTILFTNRAWDEFGSSDGEACDMTGESYFGGTDPSEDGFAAQAVDGIHAVIDDETDLFTLEYPCHSPDQQQWFMMRVAPLPDAEDGAVVVAHIDITQRKLAEIEAERRAEELARERQQLEHLLDRLNGLVQAVVEGVVHADSRAAIEDAIPTEFTRFVPYTFAWVGRPDFREDALEPAAWAGDGTLAADLSVPMDDDTVTARAIREEELVVCDLTDLPESSVHRTMCPTAHSLAVLPLAYNEAFYGVVHLYADEPDAFDERERSVLRALGRAIATAINAIESRRRLTTDSVVELELSLTDPSVFFVALSRECDCTLDYNGTVTGSDGSTLLFFAVEGGDADAVTAFAEDHPDIWSVTQLADYDDARLFEFALADAPLLSLFTDFGADLRAIEVDNGTAEFTVELSDESDARSLVDRLKKGFDGVELLAYRERERPATTRREFVASLREALTDRQHTALQKAYVGGFFDWPRTTSGDELADSMDISPSTYHQHLRVAQHKLLDAVFED